MNRTIPLHTAPPEHAARAAELRYVDRRTSGIERIGKVEFRYRKAGKWITDAATLARISKLAIPPAWTDVWICPHADGHLQATGMDAKGRRQYRYHADWSALRHLTKFDHALAFGAQLPLMRKRIAADLARPGLPQEKVLATVVSIMDHTQIRIGQHVYARENGSYGLSTLRDRHVKKEGGCVRFTFKGKTGIMHDIKLGCARLSRLVMRCKELPGQDLFQYIAEDGEPRPITSGMVNDYIRSITDGRFTSKDIRTWKGTVHCMRALLDTKPGDTDAECKQCINAALDEVARKLGNTRTVCRKYYVHPRVIEAFEKNALHAMGEGIRGTRTMLAEERIVLRMLGRKTMRPLLPVAKAA
jgi:DNA topoisomerase-1